MTYKQFIRKYQLMIGDCVKIVDSGCTYTTYSEAFKYFDVVQYAKPCLTFGHNGYLLNLPSDYKTNHWILRGIAIHPTFNNDLVCLLASVENRTFCVIGINGIAINKEFNQTRTQQIRDKNSNYKINYIPKI